MFEYHSKKYNVTTAYISEPHREAFDQWVMMYTIAVTVRLLQIKISAAYMSVPSDYHVLLLSMWTLSARSFHSLVPP